LLAFDFDHTIIDENSDVYVNKLAPNGKIPPEIKQLYSDQGWTHFMGEIFRYLHQTNVKHQQILDCMTEIKFSPGIVDLLTKVDRTKAESIIISDANSMFIEHILKVNKLEDKFDRVFTNPAKFNDDGRLEIEMYHVQDTCSLSTINLCKGQILQDYIKERSNNNVHFTHVAFIGDGQNDFCPSLRLSQKDFVFPRKGYSLVNYIKKMQSEQGLEIKANIHVWKSGLDILQVLSENVPQTITQSN
jgi:pyridoxal phosphate phosphatase PHOSPHO2